jgi:hypothetical protein
MSSCCDKSAQASPKAAPDGSAPKNQSLLHSLPLAPFISALLHGSCCWLPVSNIEADALYLKRERKKKSID